MTNYNGAKGPAANEERSSHATISSLEDATARKENETIIKLVFGGESNSPNSLLK